MAKFKNILRRMIEREDQHRKALAYERALDREADRKAEQMRKENRRMIEDFRGRKF